MEKPRAYETYEERRRYPRIVLNTPVTLEFGGNSLSALAHDLSPDGLQLRCDRKTLADIHPSGRFIGRDDAPILEAKFELEIRGRTEKVVATIKMYYFVLLPEEPERDVAFGGQFVEFREDGRGLVEAFIEEALQPLESS